MLIGFVLGAMVDAQFMGGVVGALIGQGVGLGRLQQDNLKLRQQLTELQDRVMQADAVAPASPVRAPGRRPEPKTTPVASSDPPVAGKTFAETMAPVPVQTLTEERAPTPVPVKTFAEAMAAFAQPTSAATSINPPIASDAATAVIPDLAVVTDEPAPSSTLASAEPESAAPEVASPLAEPSTEPGKASFAEPSSVTSAAPAANNDAASGRPPAWVDPEGPRPDALADALAAARGWLVGGNPVLRIGVVLLFLGLAFLLRYASERGMVPIELRYAGVAATGATLLGLGGWLRRRNLAYALILQGAGVAVLYLTVFAAIRLHPLIAPMPGFGLLVAVTIGSAILAVLQNAPGLAVVATIGGFAAPILVSTGGGNHVALFTYLVVLNAGIVAIAWFKAWRVLNLIGFLGTFGIGLAWGLRSYAPAMFASTEPFLALLFLMYVGIGLLFARRKLRDAADPPAPGRGELLRWSARQTDYVDGTVVFGPPMVGFGLQVAVVAHFEYGAAISAAALGVFYVGLARLLGRPPGKVLLLVEACLALGVVFATLAIPLALDARWTSAAWAMEGAALYWVGLRQQRPLARGFALLVQAGAAYAFLGELHEGQHTLLHGAPLGALMLGASLLFAHDQLRRAGLARLDLWESELGPPALACAGLAFVDLIAPLCFAVEGTAIAWAAAGPLTLFAGLRLRSRSYLFMALAVQLLGGALFLLDVQGTGQATGGVLDSGWRGLMTASSIGLGLLAGVVIAARDPMVREDQDLLHASTVMLLLGLGFINLAVLFVLPFALASAVWAGSGLLIVWLSLQLRQPAAFGFGLLLQVLGGAAFLLEGPALLGSMSSAGLRPLAHVGFWTPAVLAVAALIGAWRLHRAAGETSTQAVSPGALRQLSHLLLVWGSAWWALTALCEVQRFVPAPLRAGVLLLVAALSVGLWTWVALRSSWPAMARLCLTLTPIAAIFLVEGVNDALGQLYHPLGQLRWLGWGAVLVVHLLSLRRLVALAPAWAISAAHIVGCLLVLGAVTLELRFGLLLLAGPGDAWRWLGWALAPCAFLLLMASPRRLPWPVSTYPQEYRGLPALVVAVAVMGWFWTANSLGNGDAPPLTYLPLLNPLELGLALALVLVVRWSHVGLPLLGMDERETRLPLRAVIGTSVFALATAAVFRTAHQWAGVAFDPDALLDSMLVQAGLSIVWTLGALGLMVSGHLRGRRLRWTVGATLIAAVVIKLFFVELDNRGGLARIISFIGVGVLLLIVGYFAPLPPRRPDAQDKDEAAPGPPL